MVTSRTQTVLDRLHDELEGVRRQIPLATKGASISTDGRSLSQQSLDVLEAREGELTHRILSILRGGSFGRTVFRDSGTHGYSYRGVFYG